MQQRSTGCPSCVHLSRRESRSPGGKVLLGFVETGTENERVCVAIVRDLVKRELRSEQGLLCVLEGAKGFRKAVCIFN